MIDRAMVGLRCCCLYANETAQLNSMAVLLVTWTWTPPIIPRRRSACSSTAKHEVEIALRA